MKFQVMENVDDCVRMRVWFIALVNAVGSVVKHMEV